MLYALLDIFNHRMVPATYTRCTHNKVPRRLQAPSTLWISYTFWSTPTPSHSSRGHLPLLYAQEPHRRNRSCALGSLLSKIKVPWTTALGSCNCLIAEMVVNPWWAGGRWMDASWLCWLRGWLLRKGAGLSWGGGSSEWTMHNLNLSVAYLQNSHLTIFEPWLTTKS